MIAWQIKNVVKRYPGQTVPANNKISFEVREGEIFGLLGDNGAGKTTLIKQMVNLQASDLGEIRLYGKPVSQNSAHAPSLVGYMPQESHALNHLTVEEALYFSAHLRGLSRGDALAERDRLLKLWQLEDLRGHDSSRLSGGQRRLLRLAVATAGDRKILALDEPTNDLDPQKRRLVWDLLRRLKEERGATIVFITHDALEAEKIIERVGIMHRGELLVTGAPHELKRNLRHSVRLEIAFEPGQAQPLPDALAPRKLTETRWQLYLERHELGDVMDTLDIDRLVDLKLSSATLEDLYFHYVAAN